MKILVIGGTRFFGKRLVNLLVQDGHDVTVASTGKANATFVGAVSRLTIDRTNEASMMAAFAGKRWDIVYDQICFNSSDADIALNALTGKTRRIIFTSSQSIYTYGRDMTESIFDATKYIGDPENENTYQEGKRLAEKTYSMRPEFAVTSVRFPIVVGPDDHTRRLQWHIARVVYGDEIYFPNLDAHITLTTSYQAADFLRWLGNSDFVGAINAGSPDPVKLRYLLEIIELKSKHRVRLTPKDGNGIHSPFGVKGDWWANVDRAQVIGFQFEQAKVWLDSMIEDLLETLSPSDRNSTGLGV